MANLERVIDGVSSADLLMMAEAEARGPLLLETEMCSQRKLPRQHICIAIAVVIAGLLLGLVGLMVLSVFRVPDGLASASHEKMVQLTVQSKKESENKGKSIRHHSEHSHKKKQHGHHQKTAQKSRHVNIMTTSPAMGNWVWSNVALEEGDKWFPGPTVQVRSSEEHQEILGFGGAFTEASAVLFKQLNAGAQNDIIEKYFGESGLGYVMGRVHINSCDFSTGSYSFDDQDNDWELKSFDMSLGRDSGALIPLIWRAQSAVRSRNQSLKLLASPWSAPWWMKTGRTMTGSGLRPECQAVWATYIGKWIQAYRDKGIPIWGITVQNEPTSPNIFESTVMPAEEQAEFVAWHLGPTVKGWHPEVKIFAFDHNKDLLVDYTYGVAYGAGGAALKYLDGVAFHWYAGDYFQNVATVRQVFPQLMMLASEATYERSHFANHWSPTWDWSHGLGYAHDIIGDLNAGSSSWIDWNLILDGGGGPNHVNNVCDATIIVDIGQQKVYQHPQYFYIGHFSKFFVPRSRSISTWVDGSWKHWAERKYYGTCDQSDGLQATSVKQPDGKIAIVVLNCGWEWLDFRIRINDGRYTMPGKIPPQGIQSYQLPKL
eukprot:TRINITY_DN14913_c0_g1_i1.p1 TRINITY_DN14913_c0_g1~~TRINITY_DN14913_c0_g1_i1.p1  ORF type:complete len:609 (-),score=60.06 TRINITY_DN14913_c0_g1_i1:244-2043(-)